jgi:predicted ABC-type ATPase
MPPNDSGQTRLRHKIMKKITIVYIIVSAVAIALLHESLKDIEKNVETLVEVIKHHEVLIEGHRSIILELIQFLTGDYL